MLTIVVVFLLGFWSALGLLSLINDKDIDMDSVFDFIGALFCIMFLIAVAFSLVSVLVWCVYGIVLLIGASI